ncbi:peamaclein-like [Aristolochia californica]|uniref:peamaclein-like n=1 Tax=Aristolochia californica TaxID=171875 RepID=UPI0035DED2E2
MKKFASTLVLLVLLVSFSLLHVSMAGLGPSGFCDTKCKSRCAKAGLQDRCLEYCNVCCKNCKCVPSGTYGRKDECPCYRDKLNSKGKPKCP